AAEAIPEEPASWANLGVAQLRLGELDLAAEPISRALALAPDNADVVLLAGRMEIARGRLDEGVEYLRRSVDLDPRGLRARFALAEELERAGSSASDDEAQALLDELLELVRENLAVLLERTRVAAKRSDAARLRDSVSKIEGHADGWPPIAIEQLEGLQRAVAEGNFQNAARSTTLLRNVLARVPAFTESLTAV